MTRAARIGVQALILLIAGLLLAWRFSVIQQRKPNVPPAVQVPAPTEPVVYKIEPIPDAVPSPVANEPPLTGMSSSVSGRVYDAATAKGLHGIRVSARRQGGDRDIPATTDENGTFVLPDLSAGNWQLQLAGPGLPPGEHLLYVSLREGEDRQAADFPLAMGLTISGVVIDPAGENVDGASVQALGADRVNQTTTDPHGAFPLVGLKTGDMVSVLAWKAGYAPSDSVNVEMGDNVVEGLRLTLRRESSISGTLVDERGQPVTNAWVRADGDFSGRAFVMMPNTDSEGNFYIDGLSAGSYDVRAQRFRQRSPASSRFHDVDPVTLAVVELREGQHERGLRLILPDDRIEDGVVSGTVTTSDGKPVGDTVVVLENGEYMVDAKTDVQGQFSVSLPLGTYRAHATSPGFVAKYIRDVAVPSRGLSIVLERVGCIRGTVLDAASRKPITQFSVAQTLQSEENLVAPNLELVPHYDARGVFYSAAAPREVTRLAVTAPGYALNVQSTRVPPAGSSDVEFLLEPGASLSGVVVNADGRPLGGAQVFLNEVPEYADPTKGAPDRAACFTGPDGGFTLDSLPRSVETVAAFMPAYRAGAVAVSLIPGDNGRITIQLTAGARIAGSVTLLGVPAAGALLSLHITEPANQELRVTTGDDGGFEFEGVISGSGTFGARVDRDDGWSYRMVRPIHVEQDNLLDLRLDMGADDTLIEGRVTGLAADVSRTEVHCQVAENREIDEVTAAVDEDGLFSIAGMPEGPAKVSVTAFREPKADVMRQTVDILRGQTVRADFDLGALFRVSGTVQGWVSGETVGAVMIQGRVSPPGRVEEFSDWFVEQPIAEMVEVHNDGHFVVAVPAPDTYTLLIVAEDLNTSSLRTVTSIVEATPGEELYLELSL